MGRFTTGDEESKCEAKYGDKKCENIATEVVISGGGMFNLCKSCAKLVRRQNKVNNNY